MKKNKINESVLVLNRCWQAVNICTVGRALTLLYIGHAEVIICLKDENVDGRKFQTFSFEEWTDHSSSYAGEDVVHSAQRTFKMPTVILLKFFDRLYGKEVKFTRHNIFERDDHCCQYCGEKMDRKLLNLDHVIPRDMGGSTTWENIVCSCISCNTKKANRTPSQAGMRLLRKPKRPKWRPMVNVSMKEVHNPDWENFLDMADVEISTAVNA
jgi:5-methylcytosine-specific restriction endonuclease McrA